MDKKPPRSEKQKLGCLYFGRLTKEKGFDILLESIEILLQEDKNLPCEFFIFGTGPREKRLLELCKKTHQIHFFGRQSRETIKRYLPNCQVALMPSQFLETFGLSALTALSRGLPVIGEKKGGLTPFIDDALDINKQAGKTKSEQLAHLLKTTDPKLLATTGAKDISHYSKQARKENIQTMLGAHKKILLVSDFTNKIGGIETYVHDVKMILEELGLEVDIWGSTLPSGILGTLKKYLGISLSLCNVFSGRKFFFYLKKNKPDLIWYHSMIRRHGRLPITIGSHFTKQQRMMYHDLGYLAPFPHAIHQEQEIPKTLSFSNFFKAPGTKRYAFPLIFGKRCTLNLLVAALKKHIYLHLVPSIFLKKPVQNIIKGKKTEVLEHFIQE